MQSGMNFWRNVLWVALPVYLAANVYLTFVIGIFPVALMLALAAFLALLCWLTARLSRPQPAEDETESGSKALLWAQVGVIGVIILLTGVNRESVPLWSGMVGWLSSLGEAWLPVEWFGGPGNVVANPVQYFVIPFILLLLLGAKPAGLGFGKGHRVGRACLLWAALPVVFCAVLLLTGSLPVQTLVRRIISNTFQNGFFEEFLMRGALQTRLRRLLSGPWALIIQALVFGVWHLRANTLSFDGDMLAGLALCLVSQTVIGLAFGYLFQRTRNLLAPSVAHVAMNVLSQTVG